MKTLVDTAALNALRKALLAECSIHSPVYAQLVRLQGGAVEVEHVATAAHTNSGLLRHPYVIVKDLSNLPEGAELYAVKP